MTHDAASAFSVAEMGRLDFRTSRAGDSATSQLQRMFDFPFRYQPARLALGRSLGVPTPPAPVDNFDGKAIRGETLFGQGADDIGLWTSLVITHAGKPIRDRRTLQDMIAAHWARGAGLLWDDLRETDDPVVVFRDQLLKKRR